MAPKRKPAAAAATGVARRSARLANIAVAPPADDPQPRKGKKSKTLAAAANETSETEAPAEEKPAPVPEPKKGKKSKAATPAAKEDSEAETEPPAVATAAGKSVVIEHCKQCNSFKTRAVQVKLGLEKGVAGVSVVLNPEKPRRGCFEIREEGGDVFVSLLDMKRPFVPMKELDMEKVISDIVEKLK